MIIMKHLFTLLFAFVAITVSAQTPYKAYCTLQGKESEFKNHKVSIKIDFGQKTLKDNVLVDENGSEIDFRTMVSAMNYMAKRGWKYEGCYKSEDKMMGNPIFVWILSKEVSSDEEITEGFQTKLMHTQKAKE